MPVPTFTKTPGDGSWRIAFRAKYGPSNFAVSPVRESPTTIAGRYVVVGSALALTASSARNFVSS